MVDPISVFPAISSGGAAASTPSVATAVTSAFGGPIFPALGLQVVFAGLQAPGGPFAPRTGRAPGIKPGDLLRAALDIQALSEAGLVPVASTDPFTGDLVVSTADQGPILETLLGERFAREELRPTPAEVEEVGTFRDEVIASLRRPTARVVAPGVVARRTSDVGRTSRLAGPCTGLNTLQARRDCARGGFG